MDYLATRGLQVSCVCTIARGSEHLRQSYRKDVEPRVGRRDDRTCHTFSQDELLRDNKYSYVVTSYINLLFTLEDICI